jgi:hypothetical protein
MKTIWVKFLVLFFWMSVVVLPAQSLQPGFNKQEYIEMLKIAQKQHIDVDKWAANTSVPDPENYRLAYRSPVMGLENIWDLWMHKTAKLAVISVRGTIDSPGSWLPNLYAAMVPARGQLKLSSSHTFTYNFTEDPKAAVHVGWLVSTAFMSGDILLKIDSCYKAGIKDFILTGHSQGGGIVFLLTSYLQSLKTQGWLPGDIRFKTYCGAGPKPGNLYYAYAYEHMTRDGWAYNVVNTADWVPEVPFSIQTKNDFNTTNFFAISDQVIKKQKFAVRMGMRHIYKKLTRPGLKAQRNYEKYLGKMMSRSIKKLYPEFEPPQYFKSNNYVRTGATIVLYADEAYHVKFPDVQGQIWTHHFVVPYLFLAQQLK